MKIGIITITDGQNYGNRLQNYAMQELLTEYGFQVDTIQRRSSRDLRGIKKIKNDCKVFLKNILGRNEYEGKKLRKKEFDKFNSEYINFSKIILENNNAPLNLKKSYDFFIVGSDQVWNTRFDFIQEDLKNYLAFFADDYQKIAYAASFGTDTVLPEYKEVFAKELPTFKAIGVRETIGTQIIKNICGRDDSQVVLDPTMMLTKVQWENFAKKPSYIHDKPYIVTYFLGGRGEKITKYICNLSKKEECDVVNLDIEFLKDCQINNIKHFISNPNEFVWLIRHAKYVLTDSFHATVFSIIFQRPFCVFSRKATEEKNNMSSRIDTLLDTFGLSDCKDDIDNPSKKPQIYNKNKLNKILECEKRKSCLFLKNALEIDG